MSISVLSLIFLVIFQREMHHVAKTQIHILGEENEEIIYSKRFKALLLAYAVIVILLIPVVYFLFFMS